MANLKVKGTLDANVISENLGKQIVDIVYPVGIIQSFANSVNPNDIMYGQVWKKLPADRVLWSIDNGEAGGPIDAGLPNITGKFGTHAMGNSYSVRADGAFYSSSYGSPANAAGSGSGMGFGFDASHSNPIYGNSNTVRPPAIKVYMWQRIS